MAPRFTLLIAAIAAIIAAMLGHQLVSKTIPRGGTGSGVVRHQGKADIGGPFTLTDQSGRPISDRDLRGKVLVIYFGWTGDPGLTPAALQVLTDALARLNRATAARLTPVFITLDPERDTPQRLQTFVQSFAPGMLALTGTAPEIQALARQYKLYFKRIEDPSLPGGYSIEHSSHYYVVGADGAFADVLAHTTDSDVLAGDIEKRSH
jgi:protein SCO1/2